MFTVISNDVVEFLPKSDINRNKEYVSEYSETEVTPSQIDKCFNSSRFVNVELQTGTAPATASSKSDDKKLHIWLTKMLPLVEEELGFGITNVFEFAGTDNEKKINIRKYQTLAMEKYYIQETNTISSHSAGTLTRGTATWLSVMTNNAPVLVSFCSTSHSSWCTHVAPIIVVFTPKRKNDEVSWTEFQTIPVKSCIYTLSTNTFNRDMFAGGTTEGDIYVWLYESKGHKSSKVVEIFSDSTDYGYVTSLSWIKMNPMTNDHGLLSCHLDSMVLLWKIGKTVVMDKIFKISLKHENINLSLRSMITISNSEFVVGTDEGNILMCSTNKLIPFRTMRNMYDPVANEMEKHKFSVTSIAKANYKGKLYVISCDLSGVIFFHDVADVINTEPTMIIQMPLPFKNNIICTSDLELILSPSDEGGLDIYKTSNATTKKIDNTLTGQSSFIKASDNGNWIITGTYNGNFQIFRATEE